jgi:hypothetical protein
MHLIETTNKFCIMCSGMSKGGSGCWSIPLSSGTTYDSSQLNSSVTIIVTESPTINLLFSRLRFLNSRFSSLLGLKEPSLLVG